MGTKQKRDAGQSLLRRNLNLCTTEALLATPWVVLSIPGNIFIAALITQWFGVAKDDYGVIVSLPAWFNAAQLFFIPLLSRRFNPKNLSVVFSTINVVVWFGFVLALPWIPTNDPLHAARMLLVIWVLLSFTMSVAVVGWTSWVQEWIPSRLRGKYFGRRNSLTGLATFAFIFVAGETMSYFEGTVWGYQALLGITAVMRLVSVWLIARTRTPPSSPEKLIHTGWLANTRDMLANRSFLIFILWGSNLAFWFSFTGPFVPVFLKEEVGMSVAAQTVLLMIANLAAALALPWWGRMMDRHGNKSVIAVSAILWIGSNYLWVFMNEDLRWLLYPMWLWGGLFSGGVMLGGFNLLLKVIPREMKTSGVSLNLMITSVAAAVAPVIAGAILEHSQSWGVSTTRVYQIFFAINPTAILLSLFLLSKVEEPRAADLRSVFGALRTMRQALIHEGIVIMANVTPIRPIRRRLKAAARNI